VAAVVKFFKADRATVSKLVDTMRSTLLINIERNYVHEEGVFEDRQSKHRTKVRTTLATLYAQMQDTMVRMYQLFKSVSAAGRGWGGGGDLVSQLCAPLFLVGARVR
jgi:hypothetical protein